MLSDMKKKCCISLGKIPEFVHFVFRPVDLSSTVFFLKLATQTKLNSGIFMKSINIWFSFCVHSAVQGGGEKKTLAKQLNT